VGDSQVLVVPVASFRALLAQQPEAALRMALLLSRKLRQAMAWIEDMSLQPLDNRLARRLVDLHDRQTLGGAGQVELSQDGLATLVGASRQSVNREIKGWEARGWVVQRYGKLTIVNAVALRQLAQGIPKEDISV
jgi:CRP-like cAMP-binding protein